MNTQEKLEKGAFYHIYNRGNNYENLFYEEKNYTYFLELVSKHLTPIADIYAYCLMRNHFHFLIQIKENSDYDEIKLHQPFSNLFNSYTKSINKSYSRDGSLFKERFRRRPIKDEKDLQDVILYIHLNPVKHGLDEDFKDYRYSSFKSIISDKPTQLKRNFVIELFDDKENFIASHQMKGADKFDLEY